MPNRLPRRRSRPLDGSPRLLPRVARLAAASTALLLTLAGGEPQSAHAGGFELGINGAETLGRAGAFTAKADSPLAIEYNVAGLAQQRGTRVLFDSSLYFSSFRFQRAGGDSQGPYGEVSDHAGQPFYVPLFALTTDFGYFKHWTFAIGAFAPASVGRRSYGVFSPTGAPRGGAGRYDVVATDLLIIMPTLAVAYRPHRMIDIGLSVQQVSALLNLASSTYVTQNLSPQFPNSAVCPTQAEVAGCDTLTHVQVRSFDNFALQLGVLLHPGGGLHIGAHVRSAVNLGTRPIDASGLVSAGEPPNLSGLGAQLGDAAATSHMDARFATRLPWILRGGLRYAFHKSGREVGDIELDGTYELWGQADGSNNQLTLVQPPALVNAGMPVTINLIHNYKNTFSVRAAGSFIQPLSARERLHLRLGALYDSSATDSADTRIDFDTLAKVGATAGLGLESRGVTVNVGYGYLHSLPRTVSDGRLQAIDGLTGQAVVISGQPSAPINNGDYSGHNHLVSVGISILFDELVRGPGWLARRGLTP
jgi:long-subunit fatty acid transport protein